MEYRGFEIDIMTDPDGKSPDKWEDKDDFLVFDNELFMINREGIDTGDIYDVANGVGKFKGYDVFPVYAYIDNTISLSLYRGDFRFYERSNVHFSGFALIRPKKWLTTREESRLIAEKLIKSWNSYFAGETYKYVIRCKPCSGFYGEEGKERCVSLAMREVDRIIEVRRKIMFLKVSN